jgi:hypothetical protein
LDSRDGLELPATPQRSDLVAYKLQCSKIVVASKRSNPQSSKKTQKGHPSVIAVFILLRCPSPLARLITICTIKDNVDEDFNENIEELMKCSQNNSSVAKIGCFLLLETFTAKEVTIRVGNHFRNLASR